MRHLLRPLAIGLSAALSLSLNLSAQASVVYVNLTASGAVPNGTSWATAYLTVAEGVAAASPGGDEVWVAQGTYGEDSLTPGPGVTLYGGFAGNETQRSQRDWNAHPTVLDGGGTTYSMMICQSHDVTVDGFTIRNSTLGVSIGGGTATVSHNTITGNTGSGVVVNYGRATVSNNVITGNAYQGVGIVDGLAVVTIFSNIIADNGDSGIYCVNDTATTVFNNILAFNSRYGVSGYSNNAVSTFSHNDVYGNSLGPTFIYTLPANQGNISMDPLFVNRAGGNYRVEAASPCINTGDDTAVPPGATDLDGKPRIIGPHVDMGAYEFGAAPPPFVRADVAQALSLAGGLTTANSLDMARLNLEPDVVNLLDALRIARKLAGLDASP